MSGCCHSIYKFLPSLKGALQKSIKPEFSGKVQVGHSQVLGSLLAVCHGLRGLSPFSAEEVGTYKPHHGHILYIVPSVLPAPKLVRSTQLKVGVHSMVSSLAPFPVSRDYVESALKIWEGRISSWHECSVRVPPLQSGPRRSARIETATLETPKALGDDPWLKAHSVSVANPAEKESPLQTHGGKGCRVFSKV